MWKSYVWRRTFFLIDHSKSIRQRHVNKSRLYLNSKGSTVFGETFVNHLSNIFDRRLEKNYTDKMGCKDEHMSNSPHADNLKFIRKDNLDKLIIVHLNITSIRNTLDFLVDKIEGNVDIMMISETKWDNAFPNGQFLINGFNEPIRLDRNKNGGGILLFIREDILTKVLSFETSPVEGFFIEINLYKKKWLWCCSYNPDSNNIHIRHIRHSRHILFSIWTFHSYGRH